MPLNFDARGNIVSYDGAGVAAREQAVKKKEEALKGAPKLADFGSLAGKNGQLKSQYQLQAAPAINLNTQAADELRKRAMASQSPWLAQQLQQNQAQGVNQLNNAQQQAATGAASVRSALARRGGLSSGASERAAMNAANERGLAAQNATGQTAANDLNLRVNDAQQQQALLQSIPGLDLAQGQFAQAERGYNTDITKTNLANSLAEVANQRNFNLTKYQEDMKKYAADKSADATEGSGGGSVICTACFETGLVTRETFKEASKTRGKISKEKYEGYLIWAKPVAKLIKKAPLLGRLFRPAVRYLAGERDLSAKISYAICNTLTFMLTKRSSRAVQIEGPNALHFR